MMATETPVSLPTPHRRPLQIISSNITPAPTKPKKADTTFTFYPTPTAAAAHDHHKNNTIPAVIDLPLDASLADELTAVKKRLERLRAEREKTEKVLEERARKLDLMMAELIDRGEFQKELEIEVDRLYRLNQLHLASMRRSPIRSLRERQMLKSNKAVQSENSKSAKSGESCKEDLTDQCSTTGSPAAASSSFQSSSILSTGASTLNWSSSSRMSPIPLRLSLDSTASSNI